MKTLLFSFAFTLLFSSKVMAKSLIIKAVFPNTIKSSSISVEWEASNPLCVERDEDDNTWLTRKKKYKDIVLKLQSTSADENIYKAKIESNHSFCKWKFDELILNYCLNSIDCKSIRLFDLYNDHYKKEVYIDFSILLDSNILHINYPKKSKITLDFKNIKPDTLSQIIYALKKGHLNDLIFLLEQTTPEDLLNIKTEFSYYGRRINSLHWISALKGDLETLNALFESGHKLKDNSLLSHVIFYTAKYQTNIPFNKDIVAKLIKHSPDINDCAVFNITPYGYALEQKSSKNTDIIIKLLKNHPLIDLKKRSCLKH